MGLDMYLHGREDYMYGDTRPERDGFPVSNVTIEVHYWRKHPNLHGFIVKNFAEGGEDDCKPIYLTGENIRAIIDAIETRKLPETTGFFFGKSADTMQQMRQDVAAFNAVLAWMHAAPEGTSRIAIYEASW